MNSYIVMLMNRAQSHTVEQTSQFVPYGRSTMTNVKLCTPCVYGTLAVCIHATSILPKHKHTAVEDVPQYDEACRPRLSNTHTVYIPGNGHHVHM